jgi:hypothetical protein
MEPFFSGMAIGLAILIPLVILMFAIRVLYLIGAFVYGFILAAATSGDRQRGGHFDTADSKHAKALQDELQ